MSLRTESEAGRNVGSVSEAEPTTARGSSEAPAPTFADIFLRGTGLDWLEALVIVGVLYVIGRLLAL